MHCFCLFCADAEHFGIANRANTLSGSLTVLHRDLMGVLDFALGFALDTVRFSRHADFLPRVGLGCGPEGVRDASTPLLVQQDDSLAFRTDDPGLLLS